MLYIFSTFNMTSRPNISKKKKEFCQKKVFLLNNYTLVITALGQESFSFFCLKHVLLAPGSSYKTKISPHGNDDDGKKNLLVLILLKRDHGGITLFHTSFSSTFYPFFIIIIMLSLEG